MDDVKDTILDWLRDAHAMEQQSEKMLAKFADRVKQYPELKSHITNDLERAKRQQKMLRNALENHGSSTSAIKDMGAKMLGFTQAISGIMVSDEVLKGVMSLYVFQHLKIASYKILRVAAIQLRAPHTLAACEQTLPEELASAEWLRTYIPELTEKFLLLTADELDKAR